MGRSQWTADYPKPVFHLPGNAEGLRGAGKEDVRHWREECKLTDTHQYTLLGFLQGWLGFLFVLFFVCLIGLVLVLVFQDNVSLCNLGCPSVD